MHDKEKMCGYIFCILLHNTENLKKKYGFYRTNNVKACSLKGMTLRQ